MSKSFTIYELRVAIEEYLMDMSDSIIPMCKVLYEGDELIQAVEEFTKQQALLKGGIEGFIGFIAHKDKIPSFGTLVKTVAESGVSKQDFNTVLKKLAGVMSDRKTEDGTREINVKEELAKILETMNKSQADGGKNENI